MEEAIMQMDSESEGKAAKRKREEQEDPVASKKTKENSKKLRETPQLIVHTQQIKVAKGRQITKQTFQFVEDGKNLAEGLTLYTDIFSKDELLQLHQLVKHLETASEKKQFRGETTQTTALRTMLAFGYHYQYFPTETRKKGIFNGIEVEPIQEWMKSLTKQLLEMDLMKFTPDSFLFNIYHKGGGIPAHIDHKASFVRPIYSIRLLSGCPMAFGGNSHLNTNPKFKVMLPVGSLLSMDGYSANSITHSIETVKAKTISITMRKVSQPQSSKPFSQKAKDTINTISKYFLNQ